MLLMYHYVLLKMSTWYSKHVEESNNIWRINNIQCITLVVLYGQLYPGTKQGKNFVLHPLSTKRQSYTATFSGKKNTTDNVQISNLKQTHNFTIFSQDLQSLFPISLSHYNCAHFWYPRYVLHAQSTMPANVRNKSINTPYWAYTTGVDFKAFRIIALFISGVNWRRSTTCQRTASRFWHTATRRITYKKVVSDIVCVRNIRFTATTVFVQYWEFELHTLIKLI